METTARVALRVAGQPVEVEIDRALFESLSQDLLDRCVTTATEALDLADVAPEALDEVLLVGGSTRMPMVQARLRALFGDIIACPDAPETLVARGAALAGALSFPAADAAPLAAQQRRIQDVTSHDLGLVVLDADLVEQSRQLRHCAFEIWDRRNFSRYTRRLGDAANREQPPA